MEAHKKCCQQLNICRWLEELVEEEKMIKVQAYYVSIAISVKFLKKEILKKCLIIREKMSNQNLNSRTKQILTF